MGSFRLSPEARAYGHLRRQILIRSATGRVSSAGGVRRSSCRQGRVPPCRRGFRFSVLSYPLPCSLVVRELAPIRGGIAAPDLRRALGLELGAGDEEAFLPSKLAVCARRRDDCHIGARGKEGCGGGRIARKDDDLRGGHRAFLGKRGFFFPPFMLCLHAIEQTTGRPALARIHELYLPRNSEPQLTQESACNSE